MRVGLIVNPIAGLGGAAGFKGSDDRWQEALEGGAQPKARARAAHFVAAVDAMKPDHLEWLTMPGAMGVDGLPTVDALPTVLGETTAENTAHAANAMLQAGVDLLCFVGGDGTATDVAKAIGDKIPCLGIPGGVKITSPVFAHDPDEAAWLVSQLNPGFPTVARDVTDLDEQAYREGRLDTRLTGSLVVPLSPMIQGAKCATSVDTPLEPLVEQVMGELDDGAYLMGAGSVCMAIKKQFWGEPTLLGVDAIVNGRIVATDLNGAAVERFVADHPDARILLSIIGGQGMLLGRGTQVLTPSALNAVGWGNFMVVAPPEKLVGLRGLHVDSGDPTFDQAAPKYLRITSGWNETRMVRVLHGAAEQPR